MSFYQTKTSVEQYISMAEGFDGRALIAHLGHYLVAGASVLEIGMGPGVDLDLLRAKYNAIGSDFSNLFLNRYQSTHPDADLLQLDAITLDTEHNFDGIYSNKVLHHLDDASLRKSISRQASILSSEGVVLHSFWYGNHIEEHAGMKFHYRNEAFLLEEFSIHFEILELKKYTELEENDSIFLIGSLNS